MVGLADRDLGISDATWAAWCEAIQAHLAAGWHVDQTKLSALRVTVGG